MIELVVANLPLLLCGSLGLLCSIGVLVSGRAETRPRESASSESTNASPR